MIVRRAFGIVIQLHATELGTTCDTQLHQVEKKYNFNKYLSVAWRDHETRPDKSRTHSDESPSVMSERTSQISSSHFVSKNRTACALSQFPCPRPKLPSPDDQLRDDARRGRTRDPDWRKKSQREHSDGSNTHIYGVAHRCRLDRFFSVNFCLCMQANPAAAATAGPLLAPRSLRRPPRGTRATCIPVRAGVCTR